MDQFLYIVVSALVLVLMLAQIALAIHQLQKKAPDGKPLLIINLAAMAVWLPICILKFIYPKALPLVIVWFVLTAAYMFFTLWYTKNLSKNFPK